ncbi:DUF3108 domain-containing protein [Poritiphilus flavus]|uniref:DUF3108 domain-containing protein n=1 Tax=Poritiphilus flavus TaxID=2697053 RepID=A0A6L9EHX5_9FLAO|nr:DUF3108 domain-containing protein [Poritiphilus flavus]NAS14397.1 hypothetical protein [Poritiphilus flavus]
MKNVFITLCLIFLGSSYALSQNCSKYYLIEENATFQYTMYGKNGKSDGTIDYRVSDVNSDGSVTHAKMNMKVKDKKGKKVAESSYNLSCSGDKVTIDFESLLNSDMMAQFQDMEVEVTGTDIELPNELNVGQALPDASVSMQVAAGVTNINMTVDMVNRKVEKKETLTTPAGTFECYVIYSDNKTKMMMERNFPSRMWLTEGVGMVKTENYNQGGKLVSSTVLTAYSN